jgi:hypothetical protein
MKQKITDAIEHCPLCGRYYTDDDADCQCQEEQVVNDWSDLSESTYAPNQYEAHPFQPQKK